MIGSTSLKNIQNSNGVFTAINGVVPEFLMKYDHDYLDQRMEQQMFIMTRKRYHWNIEC